MHCQGCSAERYFKDQYCPHCGHHHQESMKILQCDEVNSDFANLKEDLPNSEVFTGVVVDTLRYLREKRTKKEVTEIGLWWITLDNGVEQRQLSISSEDAVHDNVNRGDVITVFRSSGWVSTYNIKKGSAQSQVTNDHLARALVVHGEQGQQYSECPYRSPSPKVGFVESMIDGLFGSVVPVGIGWGVATYFDFSVMWQVWAAIAALICFYYAFSSVRHDAKRHQSEMSFYRHEVDYFDRILQCDRVQLNATNLRRPHHPDDHFCNQCQSRHNADLIYCPQCGSATSVDHIEASDSSNLSLEARPSEHVVITPKASPSGHVKDLVEQHISPHLIVENQDYTHEFGVGPKKQGQLKGDYYIGIVVVRELESNVKEWVDRQYETTTYTNAYGKSYKESRLVSETQHRRSEINGFLVLRNSDGEEFPYVPTQNQLSETDVGDVVLIGITQVDLGKEQKEFQQLYYNLTKGSIWDNECISHYSRPGITAGLSIWSLIAAGGIALSSLPGAVAAVPVVFSLLLWGRGYEAKKANQEQRQRFADNVKNIRFKAIEQKEQWLGWLS
ncbi:Double zinc ribbon protein [Vibrio crassostreae]|nr:hypothetical protein EDB51_12166 [Vibrio crassostreae]CAK1953640.1 Double zinc ribbon protein [Vibrio crassostreae]CAK1968145.1 Double zinc ribbon protein [Vibrio crassostreae]CAK1988570.1 Double zinc ribbon protein [Vibrio crassostreae]CAK2000734.1 Double zinc ribbon protein [Vibrio crassostreae]